MSRCRPLIESCLLFLNWLALDIFSSVVSVHQVYYFFCSSAPRGIFYYLLPAEQSQVVFPPHWIINKYVNKKKNDRNCLSLISFLGLNGADLKVHLQAAHGSYRKTTSNIRAQTLFFHTESEPSATDGYGLVISKPNISHLLNDGGTLLDRDIVFFCFLFFFSHRRRLTAWKRTVAISGNARHLRRSGRLTARARQVGSKGRRDAAPQSDECVCWVAELSLWIHDGS